MLSTAAGPSAKRLLTATSSMAAGKESGVAADILPNSQFAGHLSVREAACFAHNVARDWCAGAHFWCFGAGGTIRRTILAAETAAALLARFYGLVGGRVTAYPSSPIASATAVQACSELTSTRPAGRLIVTVAWSSSASTARVTAFSQ